MPDKSIVEKLMNNPAPVLILIGLFLVVIGAAGGWPSPALQVNELGWRIVLAAIGVIVAGVGGLLLWRESASPGLPPSCDAYGIRIVSPRPGADIEAEDEIHGTCEKTLPKDTVMRVFHIASEDQVYWPMLEANVHFDLEHKTWHTRSFIGGGPGPRDIVIALMGPAGQALWRYYVKVIKETDKWVGIDALTPDIVECARVGIVRK